MSFSFRTTTMAGGGTYIEVDLVDLVDDLQVSGQQGLQQLHRPALQSLGQDGVVGVGEGASGEIPGLPREEEFIYCLINITFELWSWLHIL